jgi:hypothetical protein
MPAQHVSLIGFDAGQGEGDGQALQGAHQVQAQAENQRECAVPVPGPSGQIRAPGGLAGAAHSTGVESTAQTSSVHTVVPAARARMQCQISGAAARSRLL